MQNKIVNREEAQQIVNDKRTAGCCIGFTSGVFDIVHAGHVDYLEQARAKCDFLVVAVNSDQSVRQYKDEGRPINPAEDRTKVIAALSSVDLVYVFEERRNKHNIEALKPDLYFKASDYKKDQVTSAPLVESYGGKVELIPEVAGKSTSALIDQVVSTYATQVPQSLEIDPTVPQPAVFVDRDGVINKEVEYLHEPDKFELYPGVMQALRDLQEAGYRIIVVTNQAGIGLGYFSKEQFYLVNKELLKAATAAGVQIDRVFFCPHSKADDCECRKPKPGMLLRAAEQLPILMEHSFCIGDKTTDLEAGRRAGIKTVLVKTGHAGEDGEFDITPNIVADDLVDAARQIIELC